MTQPGAQQLEEQSLPALLSTRQRAAGLQSCTKATGSKGQAIPVTHPGIQRMVVAKPAVRAGGRPGGGGPV